MSRVEIPIGADIRQLQAAFKQIQAEIRRTGQEGRKFAEIDFTKGGLKEYAGLLNRIRDNFLHVLTTTHRAMGARLNASGQGRALPWEIDFGRMYSDKYVPHARQSYFRAILAGTPYESAYGGEAGGGGLTSMLAAAQARAAAVHKNPWWRLGAGTIGPLMALAGIGGVASMARQGFTSAQRVAETTEELYRRTRDSGMTKAWEFLRDQVTNTGKAFGLTNEQTASLALEFAKTGNVLDRERVARESLDAAAFGMGFGIAPSTAVQAFGKAAFMGLTGPGAMDPKQFALMLGETIARTGMGGRAEQVAENLLHYTEQLANQTARPASAAEMEGFLGLRGAMYAQGALRGPLGDSLIQQAQHALVNPGMGEAGQFFMMRALGGQAGYDPAKVRYLRERGLFATGAAIGGPGGKTNLDLVMERLASESRGLPNRFWQMEMGANLFGMTMPQFEEWQKVWQQMGGTGRMGAALKRAGVKPEDVAAGGIGELGQILMADERGLRGIAARYREKGDLKTQETALLDNARTTDQLRDALVKIAAGRNLEPTPWRELQSEIAKFQAVMEGIGRELIKVVTDLLSVVNRIADFFTELRSKFANSAIGRMLGYEQTEWAGSVGMASQHYKAWKEPLPGAFRPGTALAKSKAFQDTLAQLERANGLPTGLMYAMGYQESGFDPSRVGTSGELGMWQFMKGTGKSYGLATDADRRDVQKSTRAAAAYAKSIQDLYRRRIKNWDSLDEETQAALIAAGYNGGEGRIADIVGPTYEPGDLDAIGQKIPGAYRHMLSVRRWREEYLKRRESERLQRQRDRYFNPDERIKTPYELQQPQDLPPASSQPSAMREMQAPVGQLEVTIRQQDGRGLPIGEDARHTMNLRTPRPFGRVDIEGVNGAFA